jgi:CRP-like cAMP-binding protein
LKQVQAFMIQTAQTALVNGRFRLDARLARWLLMAHDRMDGNEVPLTHEFLGVMLGVGRPVVTVTLSSLERQGLIKVGRGNITLLDRKGIKAIAGRSYGGPKAERHRLRS